MPNLSRALKNKVLKKPSGDTKVIAGSTCGHGGEPNVIAAANKGDSSLKVERSLDN